MRWTCLCVLAVGFLESSLGIGVPAVGAQEKAPTEAASNASDTTSVIPADLARFIAPDFCAVVVLHPSRIIKSPALEPLASFNPLTLVPRGIPGVDLKPEAFAPAKIRRLLLLIDVFPGGNVIFFPALIVQFEEDVQGKELLGQIFKDLQLGEFAGQKYYKSQAAGMAKTPMAAYVADGRTIVAAPEPTMRKIFRRKETEAPLWTQLRGHPRNDDVSLTLITTPAVARLEKILGEPVQDGMDSQDMPAPIKTLLQDVKSVSIGLNLSGKMLIRGQVVTASPKAAEALETRMSTELAKTKIELEAMRKRMPKDVPPEVAKSWEVVEQVLAAAEIERKEQQIEVTVKMPAGLGELSRRIAARLAEK